MEWISVKDRLPAIPDSKYSYEQQVKVIGCWGEHWSEFSYVRRMVRGKQIDRFEWNGRINTFPIEYWGIPLPPKPNE